MYVEIISDDLKQKYPINQTSIYENRVLVVGHNGRSKMVSLRGMRGFLVMVAVPLRAPFSVGYTIPRREQGQTSILVLPDHNKSETVLIRGIGTSSWHSTELKHLKLVAMARYGQGDRR